MNTTSPTIVLMAGLPGTGKTTLSQALGRELGWPVLDKDTVKSALLEAQVSEEVAGPASYYAPLALCYDLLVQQRMSVIFDSPAAYANVVEEAQTIASAAGGTLKVILCQSSTEIRNQRLTDRSRRLSQTQGDLAMEEENLRQFMHLPATALRLDTENPSPGLVAQALAYLQAKEAD